MREALPEDESSVWDPSVHVVPQAVQIADDVHEAVGDKGICKWEKNMTHFTKFETIFKR